MNFFGKDIYIAVVSSAHNVCPKGYYIAIVSTIAETKSNHHVELQAGFERLGPIAERFMGPPIPLYEPLESGVNDNIYISKSYDASSHFETTTGEVFFFFYPFISCLITQNFCAFSRGVSALLPLPTFSSPPFYQITFPSSPSLFFLPFLASFWGHATCLGRRRENDYEMGKGGN
jgi:hypothetical protein